MSGAQPMGSVRRRMPGMTPHPMSGEAQATLAAKSEAIEVLEPAAQSAPLIDERSGTPTASLSERRADTAQGASVRLPRRQVADYASTRLVNFRIPTDLHDRFRALVREAEATHPRLRKPSLTELLIALLEEGPETPDEVAELIRRKRAREHAEI